MTRDQPADIHVTIGNTKTIKATSGQQQRINIRELGVVLPKGSRNRLGGEILGMILYKIPELDGVNAEEHWPEWINCDL